MATWDVGSQPGDDYPTISAAVAAVGSDTWLYIRNEVFTGGDFKSTGFRVHYLPHGDNQAGSRWVLNATGYSRGIYPTDFATVISGGEIYGCSSHAIQPDGSSFWTTVRGCYLHDVGGSGFYMTGADCTVEETIIGNVGGYGIYHAGDGFGADTCLVYNTGSHGIAAATHGTGVSAISNSTIYNATGSGFLRLGGFHSVILRNTISAGNSQWGFSDPGSLQGASGCLGWDNGSGDFDGPGGGTHGDPAFVDAAGNDFRIGAASLARGLGSAMSTPDIAGNPRPDPVTSAFDAGAYQYVVLPSGVIVPGRLIRNARDARGLRPPGGRA